MDGPHESHTRHSRRSFLRAATLGSTVGLTGCVGRLADVGGWDPEAAHGTPTGPGAADRTPVDTEAFTTFRGNLQRHGYYPEVTVPTNVRTAWRIPGINVGDHTAAKASAVRDREGNYIIPGDSGEVHSFTVDGKVNWVASTYPSGRGIHGTPTIANGLVYIGAYDGALYAFDVGDGSLVWRTQLGGSIGSSPAYHDGVVYIAVEHPDPEGSMAGCDALTGEVVWTDERPTDHPHSILAIDRDAGRLTVGSNDGNLYGWSYPALEHVWTFETARPIKGPIATFDGGAFFGSWDHSIYRVNLETGEEEWSFETEGMVMGGASIDPETGMVYIGGHDGKLRALDAATGEEQWQFATEGLIVGCPALTREHVLVGSYDTNCYAIRRDDGESVWRVSADGWVSSVPHVDDDGIVFTSRATDDTSGKAIRLVEMV
ncbi:Outer membrane protein assembly factor BamB, contains PQQ-like beta-propeller repeat [Halogranum rubrum]|uniref:Outer membrane protein assembly factor BamB, contains PQQ-like beta-propeller repeat n=1 Tax=Halogranum rubrum TaxID=553466 RepID=A0A1I4CWP8_9EURY|nr:PQQ-binding-like beta-propeller repeat protein [Halogranum rubrum]SFK85728.1 Outer membrane protein assembly factor BamB, contains PQQ-like beta-propeller repeat [Halogranum rubrum]